MGDKRLTHSRVFRTERVASHAHRPPRLGQCMTLSAGWYELSRHRPAHQCLLFDLRRLPNPAGCTSGSVGPRRAEAALLLVAAGGAIISSLGEARRASCAFIGEVI